MRRQLAILAAAVTGMVVLAFLIPLGLLVRRQAEDRALAAAQRDAQAVASGLAVAGALSLEGTTQPLADLVVTAAGSPEGVTVYLPDGSTAGAEAIASDRLEVARRGSAFTTRVDGGVEVLVPVSAADGTSVVRAFVADARLRTGVVAAWIVLALLGGVLIVVAVVVSDRLGRSTVRPTKELATAAHDLGMGDLGRRVTPDGPPELVEVGKAFNVLAGRLRDLLTAERELVADMSHRLRTPLAAVRLQAEQIDDGAALIDDLDRLEAAIDQLIVDARMPEPAAAESDLAEVVRNRGAFWGVLARAQERGMEITLPDGPVVVAVPPAGVADVVDSLVQNVFAHTAPGTSFSIRVSRHSPQLTVKDRGDGFPGGPPAMARGISGTGSTGLGLDIVRRVAEQSGGRVAISGEEGASVEVHFGTPTEA